MSWRIPALVFVVACAVFAPSVQIGFMLDDGAQILSNRAVREFDVAAIFGQGYWANVAEPGVTVDPGSDLYRPLSTLSVALSHAAWGDAAAFYHAENVLMHALASVLVVVLLASWGMGRVVATAAGLLFAVAPIHIEPIGSVVLRNELLAAIFGLLFLRSMAAHRCIRASAWLLAALLAKESAIALPFVALVADRVFVRPGGAALRRYLPMVFAGAVYLGVRYAVLGRLTLAPHTAYFGPDVPWLDVWLTMARFAWEHYALASFVGAPLVFDFSADAFPRLAPADPAGWVSLAAWVVLGVAAVWAGWVRRAPWGAGVLVFALLLGPVANVATRIGVLGAGRLAYLPHLGVSLLAGLVARELWRRAPRPLVAAVGGLVIVGLVVQTERRLAVWNDPLDFYADIVEQAPRNGLALGFLGERQFMVAVGAHPAPAGSETEPSAWCWQALDHLVRSVEIEPRNWQRVVRELIRSAVVVQREVELLQVLERAIGRTHAGASPAGVRPAAAEWEPLDRLIRGQAAQVLRSPLVGDPRFAREIVADFAQVVPDLVAGREGMAVAEAWERGVDPGARQVHADARVVHRALEALRRLQVTCLTRLRGSASTPGREVARLLAAGLYAQDYARLCDAWIPRLEAVSERF